MNTGTKKVLLVAGALVLTAVLYFMPQRTEEQIAATTNPSEFTFDDFLIQVKGSLKKQEIEIVNNAEAELEKEPKSIQKLDSLGFIWDKLNVPAVSAHYFERSAELKRDERGWINAAYRYFDAFKMTNDSLFRAMFTEKAINAYKKVLEINPSNLDAKTDLGVCYAEGTNTPMQGIIMLREVVTENPEHENAQFNLGILSVQSGQYDKAIERFEKVLEINPRRNEARFLLARTYAESGNNDLALQNLRIVSQGDADPAIKSEANSLIDKINNN